MTCRRPAPIGTFYVNSTTGAYTFVPDSGAINALKAPTTTELHYHGVGRHALSQSDLPITINGINDAAVISGTPAGSVIEAGGVANAATGTPTATGTLTDTDVDDPPNTFTAVRPTPSRRLRQLHDDGGRRVDLHARQRQQRGAGAQCRRHADRQLHGDHRRRHPAGGDDHHQRQQRRRRHFRHHDRRSDRDPWRRQCHAWHADRDRHAHRHRPRQSAQYLHGGRPTPSALATALSR